MRTRNSSGRGIPNPAARRNEERGVSTMVTLGSLPKRSGVLVHDCRILYAKLTSVRKKMKSIQVQKYFSKDRHVFLRRWIFLLEAITCLGLSGCFMGINSGYSGLCYIDNANGWNNYSGGRLAELRKFNVEYSIAIVDDYAATIHEPIENAYWLKIYFNRKSTNSDVSGRVLATSYNPGEAVLHINGMNVPALARGWLSNKNQPGPEVSLPIRLNNEKNEFFIVFPISVPSRWSSYTVTLGTVFLNEERIALPTMKSCNHLPSLKFGVPIPLG